MSGRLCLAFDLDGVLVSLSDELRVRRLADLTGREPAWIQHQIWGSGFEDRSDAGEFDADTYLQEFGRQIEYPITESEWIEVRRAGMTLFAETLAYVAELKTQHPAAILTNNGWQLKRSLYRIFPELEPVFGENLHVSAEFGCRKPEPRVYTALCDALNWTPATTLFIDDRRENVEGAVSAGLLGHHFVSRDGLQQAIAERSGTSPRH